MIRKRIKVNYSIYTIHKLKKESQTTLNDLKQRHITLNTVASQFSTNETTYTSLMYQLNTGMKRFHRLYTPEQILEQTGRRSRDGHELTARGENRNDSTG